MSSDNTISIEINEIDSSLTETSPTTETSSLTETSPTTEPSSLTETELDTVLSDPSFNPLIVEPIISPPNPIVELMKEHSKIALLIGLNYVDFPEITLQNRIKACMSTKQILISSHGFAEENILVLTEPTRETALKMLNTIIGSSNLVSEIIIYYSGYGNGIMKTDTGFCAEPGVIDNLAKQIMPADFAEISQDEMTGLLYQSCCKTVCIMDMSPYGNDEMFLKWSADVNNQVKIITLCESDTHNTNKNQLIQMMLQNAPTKPS